MTRYFLGVDIGNTKSHALICDETGHAVGVGFGGSGNHERLGKDGFAATLNQIVVAAAKDATISLDEISSAGYGIAGYDWPEDLPMMREVIEALPFGVIPYDLMNDAGPGLIAASSNGWGISISAGTSVNARGRDANGRIARVTGNSLRFGEYGGGQELVYRSVQTIAEAWSMRGPQTQLADLFIQYANAKDIDDLLAGIARERYHFGAAQAPLVFRAADAGDYVAQENIKWLGRGLGDIVCGIIRQLEIEHLAFDVVMSGSIYQGSPLILESMKMKIHELASEARFVHLAAPPVTGAVMLAMEQVNVDYLPLRDRIIHTANQLLSTQSVDETN